MKRGEIWFASVPGGDRPVVVLTRDPVADRIGAVVVAALTRTKRNILSELELFQEIDGVPSDCVINCDNIHTVARKDFRKMVVALPPFRMKQLCQTLRDATGC